jgi:hypothetical protein
MKFRLSFAQKCYCALARLRHLASLGMAVLLLAPSLAAQTRIAEGRVLRPSASGRPAPVPGLWVVLHRVGSDRAGPLDSVRVGRDGRFRFRYRLSGASDALYFVSARYGGIAYFSPPLRSETVRGADAEVMVYDTTSNAGALRVQGWHFVLSALRGGRRRVAEIFELENPGSRTIVALNSTTPAIALRLPAAAESAAVAPGDVTAATVAFRGGRAEVFAPVSPGIRQLVLTYTLPEKAFPFSHPVERDVSVLEVLVEEPLAEVEGARLAEVPPASIDGRMFRRFLAQDVPASSVFHVAPPPPIERNRSAIRALAIVVAIVLAGGLAFWYARRRGPARPAPASPVSEVDRLVAELASLDARFERAAGGEDSAEYQRRRAELRARLERALAAENVPA